MNKKVRDYSILALMAGLIIIVDQVTKYMVRTNIPLGDIWSPWPWLTPYARIIHWNNTGAAFGMFQGFGGVFTFLAIVVAIAIIYYFPQVPRSDWPLRIAMGMQLGGALGNLIDRLTQQGHVTDFISLGNFAVFNVADACISVGVAVLLVGVWIKEQKEKIQTPGEPLLAQEHPAADSVPVDPQPEEHLGE